VHAGHLILAEQAREQLDLECVLWVPAGQPWRKTGREVTQVAHRLEMVRRAVEGNEAFMVVTDEVERGGPSYTVDTLRVLQERYPEARFWLIVGADALAELANWREPERLVQLATLAVARRAEVESRIPRAELPSGARAEWIEMPLVDVSATDIRRRVAEGKTIRYLVPRGVEEYVAAQGLYR